MIIIWFRKIYHYNCCNRSSQLIANTELRQADLIRPEQWYIPLRLIYLTTRKHLKLKKIEKQQYQHQRHHNKLKIKKIRPYLDSPNANTGRSSLLWRGMSNSKLIMKLKIHLLSQEKSSRRMPMAKATLHIRRHATEIQATHYSNFHQLD